MDFCVAITNINPPGRANAKQRENPTIQIDGCDARCNRVKPLGLPIVWLLRASVFGNWGRLKEFHERLLIFTPTFRPEKLLRKVMHESLRYCRPTVREYVMY